MSRSGLNIRGNGWESAENQWEWAKKEWRQMGGATNEWEWMRVGGSTRQYNSFIISKIYFSLLNVMFIVLYEMIIVPC